MRGAVGSPRPAAIGEEEEAAAVLGASPHPETRGACSGVDVRGVVLAERPRGRGKARQERP